MDETRMSHDNDEYETSDPLTMGGATGNYVIPSPYHTECEWCIISALAVGTLGSSATYVVGSKNPQQPTLNGTSAFGGLLTSGMDNSNALPSYPGALTSTAPFVTYGGDNYMPLPSPAYVYATVTSPAATATLITVQFRRKLDRAIPDKPRTKPQTHSRTGSRRGYRTMMEGFASQYPEEGAPYQHEQVPLAQDTAVGKRGVLPLGPTTITHRGVGKKNGH
jgi:hypothetical protein